LYYFRLATSNGGLSCDVCLWSATIYSHEYLIYLFGLVLVVASVALTKYRTRVRRQMNERDVVGPSSLHAPKSHQVQVTRGIHTDCLLNYETVKYFSGEEHEGDRYRDAVREYQGLEYKVISA